MSWATIYIMIQRKHTHMKTKSTRVKVATCSRPADPDSDDPLGIQAMGLEIRNVVITWE